MRRLPPATLLHVCGCAFAIRAAQRCENANPATPAAAGSEGEASIDVERIAEQRVIPQPFVRPTNVVICHFPPGNPGNAHTIVVDSAAVPAHKGHGDTLGSCPND